MTKMKSEDALVLALIFINSAQSFLIRPPSIISNLATVYSGRARPKSCQARQISDLLVWRQKPPFECDQRGAKTDDLPGGAPMFPPPPASPGICVKRLANEWQS